jgi:thiamine-phosphate pyrophosphorylase
MSGLLYRAIDANFNRVREGLRVCEEFVRFVLEDKELTEDFKRTRSRISKLYIKFPRYKKALLSSRNVASDVGRKGFPVEKKREGLLDIFWANIQRSKEALRVLEEFSKLEKAGLSDEFRKLRFKTYEIEKRAFKKLNDAIRLRQKK